jgi:peptidoglycan/LPS O-acetylase OafA/YrhL
VSAPDPPGLAAPTGVATTPGVTGAPRAGPRAWLPSLQSLRGLAALWVVLYHLDVTLFGIGQGLLPFPGPRFGWLGVDLFFVLSAYLLGQPFVDGRARPYWRFLGDRLHRLAPAYYGAAALSAAVVLLISVDNFRPGWVALNLVFLTNVDVDAYFALNPALWSLAVEMQFYLVLPLLARLFTGRRWPLGLAVCIAIAAAVRAVTYQWADLGLGVVEPFDALFFGTFGMPAFLAHFGLGLAACRLRTIARPALAALVGLPLLVVPAVLWVPDGSVAFGFETFPGQVAMRLVAACGATLLVLAAASAGLAQRLLGVAPLRWLGDISYSLYLAHIPVQLAMTLAVDPAGHPWAWCAAAVAASLASGAALHYGVERPFEARRHQRKLRERLAARPAGA